MESVKQEVNESRKGILYVGISILILILILSTFFINIGLKKENKSYIQYSDKKDLEYKVVLKENEYYKEKYVEKGNQYIANLINYINADFKYDFNLQDKYDYKYKIVGTVEVADEKTNKNIYTFSEDLLGEKNGHGTGNLNIDECISIDFNKYNNLIKQFVTTYDLKNASCKLIVKLNLGVKSPTQKFSEQNLSVMSLDIPLTTNTIKIDANYDLSENDNLIEINKENKNNKMFLITGISLLIADIFILVSFIVYMKKSETDKDKYNNELKKIINNYDSYISRLEDDFDMKGYQILRVKKFSDLLEIRDTMQLPIIMLENKEQLLTYFAIPTPNNILYFYLISVNQYMLSSGKHTSDKKEVREDEEKKVSK